MIRGRGSPKNPSGRFESVDRTPQWDDFALVDSSDLPTLEHKTQMIPDHTKSVISRNKSPDVGFEQSINPYRGCEHGCAYCYARPTHEFLGHSAGLDFETKIYAKLATPDLLRKELIKKNYKVQTIVFSGVTDCYQPIERTLQITRKSLEVLDEFRHPTMIITKNHLVTRDIDILARMAIRHQAAVTITITTLDDDLRRKLEPRASTSQLRMKAVQELAGAGIPVGVNLAPIIPGLTDHEIPEIIRNASDMGASFFNYVMLRLPYGVKDIFSAWLDEAFPTRKEKILSRVLDIRKGKLNESAYHTRMRGQGNFSEQIARLFRLTLSKYQISNQFPSLNTAAFRIPQSPDCEQGDLFSSLASC